MSPARITNRPLQQGQRVTCRRVRQLHFVDMVGVEQLLEVMAQDEPPVAERIQRLLLPSYLPGAARCHAAALLCVCVCMCVCLSVHLSVCLCVSVLHGCLIMLRAVAVSCLKQTYCISFQAMIQAMFSSTCGRCTNTSKVRSACCANQCPQSCCGAQKYCTLCLKHGLFLLILSLMLTASIAI